MSPVNGSAASAGHRSRIGLSVAPTASGTVTVGEVGERKQLTVLFADVLGSMDVQEHLDAEGWARIMGRLVDILAEGVRRFGGTVDKFTGDGIMALFGAPVRPGGPRPTSVPCRLAHHPGGRHLHGTTAP